MNDYIPFVHDPEIKKEWEPESLYIELYPPPLKKQEKEIEEDTSLGIIIIQL